MLLQAMMKKVWMIGGLGVAGIPEGAGVYVLAKVAGSRFPNGCFVVVYPEFAESSAVPAEYLEFTVSGATLEMYLEKIPTIPQYGPEEHPEHVYRVDFIDRGGKFHEIVKHARDEEHARQYVKAKYPGIEILGVEVEEQ